MKDFKQVVYRTDTKAYVINDNTYTVPSPDDETVPAEIHKEFDDLYAEVDEWANANPDKVIVENPYIPSKEELDIHAARNLASESINKYQRQMVLQAAPFTAAEFNALAITHSFDLWEPNKNYTKGYRFEYDDVIYECVQDVLSLEHQTPSSEGMLAIYRPLSDKGSFGTQDGSLENPYQFKRGMNVYSGKYYKYNDNVYLCKGDMIPCVWPPDTKGIWQWEKVEKQHQGGTVVP